MKKLRYMSLGLALALLPLAAQAAGPQAPCGVAANPSFAAPDAPPAVAVFHASDLDKSKWVPSPCTGWNPGSRSTLVVAGQFRFSGTIDQILARIAAISTLSKVQYWSTTSGNWRPVAYEAAALSGPNAKDRRPDFTAPELKKGAQLYYWENDSRSGEVVMRMSIRERTTNAAVIGSENVTPVASYFITMFPPGTLQGAIVIRKVSDDLWGLYLLSRTLEGSSILAGGHEASYVNRAVALYRQIAGIRTNAEPPAQR